MNEFVAGKPYLVRVDESVGGEGSLQWLILYDKAAHTFEVIIGEKDPKSQWAVRYTNKSLETIYAFLEGYQAGLGV